MLSMPLSIMAAAAPAQYVISGVGCMVWAAWCGLHGVGGMVWAAWCGRHGVGCMVWAAWCGRHGVDCMVWAAWCGLGANCSKPGRSSKDLGSYAQMLLDTLTVRCGKCVGFPKPYLCTLFGHIFGEYPAQNTVRTLYI